MTESRFEDPGKYESYLNTATGRLRSDLAWEHLRGYLPSDGPGRRALDIGGGTGATSIRLARAGFEVALVDHCAAMLDFARGQADAARVTPAISFVRADAVALAHLFPARSFDVVVCHNVLEYVDDAPRVVCDIAWLLRDGGVASVLVRNRFGEVMKAAIVSADIEQAIRNLTADAVGESLYGGTVWVFAPRDIRSVVERAGLDILAERGVRVLSDYVRPSELPAEALGRLLGAELALGAQPELAAIARYTQVIAKAKPR